jgi:peptidoglycan/xylan/chitin deacetylase (PgdA/CDA1 family)
MNRLPVLTFHALSDDPTPVAYAPAEFDRLVAAFAAQGWRAAGTADAATTAAGGADRAARRVVFTFDDGYSSVQAACATLATHGFRAVLFLSPALLDRPVIFPGDPLCPVQRALTWSEARELAAAGHEIGSHAVDHLDLRRLGEEALDDQLRRSREVLEDRLGVAVDALAYPFGFHDARVAAAAARRYATAFTTELAWCRRGDDPRRLPRLDAHYLRGPVDPARFEGAAFGAYLALRKGARRIRSWIGR